MRRPLVGLAAALAAGILAGDALRATPAAALTACGAAVVAAAAMFITRRRAGWCMIGALAVFATGGAAWSVVRSAEYTGASLTACLSPESRPMRVRGFVAGPLVKKVYPPRHPKQPPRLVTRLTLAVTDAWVDRSPLPPAPPRPDHPADSDDDQEDAASVAVAPAPSATGYWRPVRGDLRLNVAGPVSSVSYGDVVEAAVAARRLPEPANAGERDYSWRLDRQGFSGTAYMPAESGFTATGARAGWPGLRPLLGFKRLCLDTIDERLPPGPAGILNCLILGEWNRLSDEQMRRFRESGAIHFLAISGLHISMIAATAWALLALAGVRHRAAAVVVLAVIMSYAALAGFEPSVQRASLMCATYCAAWLIVRRPSVLNSMAFALIVVLLLNPGDLYDAGLQLSFVAVAGMVVMTGPIERRLFGKRDELDKIQAVEERSWAQHPFRWSLQKALCLSIAAWLMTAPLVLRHFGMITPASVVAGVALLPAVWVALVIGLPCMLLSPFLGAAAAPVLWVARWSAQLLDWGAGSFAWLPGARFYAPPPGWWWVALAYAAFLAVVFLPPLRRPWRAAGLCALLALLYVAAVWRHAPPERPRLTMFAVGRGNCVLIQFPDGRNLLYDAGSIDPGGGDRILAPGLWAQGVRRLDLVVLSHADSDHCNGLVEIARRIPIGRVAVSDFFEQSPEAAPLLQELRDRRIPVLRLAAGDRIAGFGAAQCDVLWPPRDLALAKMSVNERCAVLRVATPDGSVLLTGDFGRRATPMLLKLRPVLQADILQVPHHGLPDPNAPQLAKAVRPRLALVPCGEETQTPSPYAPFARRLLTTQDYGMITVELRAGTLGIESFRKGRLDQERTVP